jgi:hypothetical protein
MIHQSTTALLLFYMCTVSFRLPQCDNSHNASEARVRPTMLMAKMVSSSQTLPSHVQEPVWNLSACSGDLHLEADRRRLGQIVVS